MPEEVKYVMSLNDLVSEKLDHAEGKARKLEGALHSVKTGLTSLGERVLSIGETLGISFAFYKVAEFAHQGVEMAHQLAQAEAQAKAGLISTNYAAGISYEALEESASKFAKTLPYTKAQIVDMQSQLVTFPSITKKNFDTASQAVMDMSARTHRGLDEISIMVGKALQDPGKGVASLHRVGVNFNEEQIKIIKNLEKTGHVGTAQAMILKELQVEFAGSAAAAANSDPLFKYNKLMEGIKIEVGEAGEALLHDLTPGLERAVGWFKTGYDQVKEFYGYLRDNSRSIAKEVKGDAIALGWGVGVATAAFLAANPIIFTNLGIMVAVKAEYALAATHLGVVTAAQWLWNTALDANPIGIVVVGLGALVTWLIYGYKHSELMRAQLTGLGEIAKDVGGVFKGLGETIAGAFAGNLSMIKEGITDIAKSGKYLGNAYSRGFTESVAESRKASLENLVTVKGASTIGGLKKHEFRPAAIPVGGGKQSTGSKAASGSKSINIHIQIGNLVKELNINTSNFKEGVNKAQEMVTSALLSAVNDSQIVAGN